MSKGDTSSPLLLSLSAVDELHLMHALIQYKQRCQRQRQQVPPMVDRVVAQVSQRATSGQERTTFAEALPSAEAVPMRSSSLVDLPDAARELGLSVRTLRRRVRDGVFTPVRNGRRVHLRRSDVQRFIDAGGLKTW